jgi:hypothetical protein
MKINAAGVAASSVIGAGHTKNHGQIKPAEGKRHREPPALHLLRKNGIQCKPTAE